MRWYNLHGPCRHWHERPPGLVQQRERPFVAREIVGQHHGSGPIRECGAAAARRSPKPSAMVRIRALPPSSIWISRCHRGSDSAFAALPPSALPPPQRDDLVGAAMQIRAPPAAAAAPSVRFLECWSGRRRRIFATYRRGTQAKADSTTHTTYTT